MAGVILNNDLYTSAVAGLTDLNGMYIFYGGAMPTPGSGATVAMLSQTVAANTDVGMARCHGLTYIPEDGASLESGGKIKFIATTANAEVVAGIPPTPGITVNAIGIAHLHPNAYNEGGVVYSSGFLKDKVLDYSVVSSGGVIIPAGGYVTLVDTITVVKES